MPATSPLTEKDLEALKTRGHCRVRAFSTEDALKMQENVWRRLEKHGVLRDDKSTWGNVRAPGLSRNVRKQSIFRETISDGFVAAIDQLLGKDEWIRPKDWGMVIKTFPEKSSRPWDVVTSNWHWHLNPLRNVDRLQDLFSFSFLTSVKPEGGGTLILEGAHHVVQKYLSELTPEQRRDRKSKQIREGFYRYHPWLNALADKSDESSRLHFMEPEDVHGFPCRVVELTGEPGEAVITDAGVLHVRSRNCLDEPRFMRAVGIRRRGYQPGLRLDDESI